MPYLLNLVPSPADSRDWSAEQIYEAASLTVTSKSPSVFTLVPYLPPVRDQGVYGTCAAQVASCMKEWQERKDVDFRSYMSPQFVYDNRADIKLDGMYARDVMSILKNKGICPEEMYPYASSTRSLSDTVLKTALNYVISGYAAINTITGLKTALTTSGPCFIAFPVYNLTRTFWKANDVDTYLGGHAVTVVGYDETGFIIRNSWGSKWGNAGYTIYPYSDWGIHWEIWTTIDAHTIVPDSPSIITPTPLYPQKKLINNSVDIMSDDQFNSVKINARGRRNIKTFRRIHNIKK